MHVYMYILLLLYIFLFFAVLRVLTLLFLVCVFLDMWASANEYMLNVPLNAGRVRLVFFWAQKL